MQAQKPHIAVHCLAVPRKLVASVHPARLRDAIRTKPGHKHHCGGVGAARTKRHMEISRVYSASSSTPSGDPFPLCRPERRTIRRAGRRELHAVRPRPSVRPARSLAPARRRRLGPRPHGPSVVVTCGRNTLGRDPWRVGQVTRIAFWSQWLCATKAKAKNENASGTHDVRCGGGGGGGGGGGWVVVETVPGQPLQAPWSTSQPRYDLEQSSAGRL